MSAAPAIALLAPQLGKLVLLLSSSHDGEVVGAARAIDRVLRSNQLDWHDLARAICRPVPGVSPRDNSDWHDWRDLLAFCAPRMSRLNSREREFLRSIAQ